MHRARQYATALFDSLKGASEKEAKELIKNVKPLLKKRGDLRLLPSFLQEFQKLWAQRDGPVARVVSARPLEGKTAESLRHALKKKGFVLKTEVDETVGGGIAVYLGNEHLVDNTIKGRMEKLWQRISY